MNTSTRKGSTATTVALMILAIIGFVAMAVDWGRVGVARYQVQSAADAAALAAAESLDDHVASVTRAQAYASATVVNGQVPHVGADDVIYGTWDGVRFTPGGSEPNAVKVVAEMPVEMPFSRLFGIQYVNVRAVAGAAPNRTRGRSPDIVIVLDVTASMSASEVAAERTAAAALMECIDTRSDPASRASIVTFTGSDHVLMDMSDFGTYGDDLAATGAGINGCGGRNAPPCSGTNPASGYYAALSILENADTPEGIGQAILLMSDGLPNADDAICTSSYLAGDFLFDLDERCAAIPPTCTGSGRNRRCRIDVTDAHIVEWTDEQQEIATARDVDVYTVYYGTEVEGQAFLADHVRANDGFSEIALTQDQIEDRFIDICLRYTSSAPGLIF